MHEFIPTAAMAGEVLLDGKDIYSPGTDVTKIRLRVGMVFQKPNPFPSMTIGENVLSGLKLAQLKKERTLMISLNPALLAQAYGMKLKIV